METFDIEKFNPTKQELIDFVEWFKWIKINWLDDYVGYDKAIMAKRELAAKRNRISKQMKSLRDWAIKFQKDVISKEKEFTWIIWEVELDIQWQLNIIENEKERLKRIETLPIRWSELKALGLDAQYTEEFILSMSYKEFCDFIITEKARLFEEEQERKIQAEQEEKHIQDIKDAEERWKKEAEERLAKKEEIRIQQEEADKRTKDVLEAQRIAEEKELAEQKIIDEQKAKERLEKWLKYKKWLQDNWYTEDNKNIYKIEAKEKEIILYKFISSFKI